jgi:8-oxo-dGTP pyrophosphatase MutT (NUDIX family)
MSAAAPPVEIVEIDRALIEVEPWSWPFAATRRAEIDRHFAQRQRRRPALWNGRVLLLRRYDIDGKVLRGESFATDYASFLAWRDWDFADPSVFNVFAAAALRSADGAYLLGEMAAHTASAGQIYFPCGTPDDGDLQPDGRLDLAGSVGRELREETGLDIDTLDAAPGWTLVRDRCFLALVRRLTAREDAQPLRARILRHLASEARPELSDIRIVRGAADLDPAMPRFVRAFLAAG